MQEERRLLIVCYDYYNKNAWNVYFTNNHFQYIEVGVSNTEKAILINLPVSENQNERKEYIDIISKIIEEQANNIYKYENILVLIHNHPLTFKTDFKSQGFVWFDGNDPVKHSFLYRALIEAENNDFAIKKNADGRGCFMESVLFNELWKIYTSIPDNSKAEIISFVMPILIDIQSLMRCPEKLKARRMREIIDDMDYSQIVRGVARIKSTIDINKMRGNQLIDYLRFCSEHINPRSEKTKNESEIFSFVSRFAALKNEKEYKKFVYSNIKSILSVL